MTQSGEREAACSCGQLRIRLAGEPDRVSSCHCQACQRRTGAIFGSTAFFKRGQVVSTEGEHRSFRRQADSGTWLTFEFCPHCGSTVSWTSERAPEIICIAVGSFADPSFPAPSRTVWTESQHEWLVFPPAIPHHRKNPA
jgi:hypothetical protein